MSALSEFNPVAQCPVLWTAQKGSLRCTAIILRDGSLCLYSPVLGLGDQAKNSLSSLGRVSTLLAPNHYHNKGLKEYAEAFPDAALICSEEARPRLIKQTGLSFGDLSFLLPLLPENCVLSEPDGLKTGEIWMTLKTSENTIWIVCDAFKGPGGKAFSVSRKIELLGTFPTYGIKDNEIYSAWVKAKLKAEPPTMIVPCHGTIIQSESLSADITSLLG